MRSMHAKDEPRIVYWLGNNLYLNITNKCSNRCIFCFRNFKSGIGDFVLKLKEEPSAEQVITELKEALGKKAWNEIVFCGFGEPLERLDCLIEVAKWIKRSCGKPIVIRVNTNGHGYLLNPGRDVAAELKAAGVDKVSVSLNAPDEGTYNEICKPTLAGAYITVLEFIEKVKEKLDVEVTAVTTPEVDLHRV